MKEIYATVNASMPLKDPLKAFPFSPFSPLFSSFIKHTHPRSWKSPGTARQMNAGILDANPSSPVG
jgi:hypothetical protein